MRRRACPFLKRHMALRRGKDVICEPVYIAYNQQQCHVYGIFSHPCPMDEYVLTDYYVIMASLCRRAWNDDIMMSWIPYSAT
jgi:hypothetical protein